MEPAGLTNAGYAIPAACKLTPATAVTNITLRISRANTVRRVSEISATVFAAMRQAAKRKEKEGTIESGLTFQIS
jgi:hypothetical protein